MDSSNIISTMIFVCIAVLLLTVFSRQIKTVFRILLGSVLGMAGIYAVNILFPSVNIGINAVTAGICGLLGLPGFAVLVLAGIIL
ncbi:MAG: pro-sigmaK processing inhibitor BofA family protein [Clostridia bacterium]|nr:pro-sigmaK processing inhibitor BofA family protein [Clostridia bacterium]